MLLIIDEPTNYLGEIYDIDSKKQIEAMDFMY
jgi:ATPase subunit of ABC transporter with duplicated ATPase domains